MNCSVCTLKSIFVAGVLLVSVGCGQKTTHINQVLQSEIIATTNKISANEISNALKTIDLVSCPSDFKLSFKAYQDAWELMALVEQQQQLLEEDKWNWKDILQLCIKHTTVIGSVVTTGIPILIPSDFDFRDDDVELGDLGWILVFSSNQLIKTKHRMNQIAETYGFRNVDKNETN